MGCEEIESILATEATNSLSLEDERRLTEHLKECETCSILRQELRETVGSLKSWEQPEVPAGLAQRTIQSLEGERSSSAGLGQRFQEFWDKLSNLDVTPARGLLAAACGFVLYLGLMNIGHQDVMPASPSVRCEGNIRAIGKAVEKYRLDHDGGLPSELGELIPDYFMRVPKCPAAGYDTYSTGYEPEEDDSGYSVHCEGHHHQAEGKDSDEPSFKSGSLD